MDRTGRLAWQYENSNVNFSLYFVSITKMYDTAKLKTAHKNTAYEPIFRHDKFIVFH